MELNLHSAQAEAWNATERFIWMLMGHQSGKTSFGPHWLRREIERCGPGDYLVVTATFPLLNLKLLPEFRWLFEKQLKLGIWYEASKVFLFNDGVTRVIFGSATNPEALASATAKAAWCDEIGQKQFKRESWEEIQRRLSLHQGRVLGTTTLFTWGWFKTDVYDRAKGGAPDTKLIQADCTVNPAFPVEEYERMRRELPSWKFNMFCRGIFERPAGMIYDCFDTAEDVVDPFPIPKWWPRYVGQDFGSVNPVAVFYALNVQTGELFMYRVMRGVGLSTGPFVGLLKEVSAGENIVKRVGGAQHEDGWRGDYTQQGWPVSKPKVRDVEQGIGRVYAMNKAKKIKVFRDQKEYLDQKQSYSRVLDDAYEATEEIENKEAYHIMDAERYIICDFRPETESEESGETMWTWPGRGAKRRVR